MPSPRASRARNLTGRTLDLLITKLGSRSASVRQRAEQEIEALGTDAIPALIAALGDQRTFEDDDRPIGAALGGSRRVRRTIGQQCLRSLYRIITPAYVSPYEPKVARKPRAPMFEIRDWQAWWELERDRPLEEIHEDVEAAVDRYWQADERTQRLG